MAIRCACLGVLRSQKRMTRIKWITDCGMYMFFHKRSLPGLPNLWRHYQHEPDDLDAGPEIPEYELLNIRLRGYDFAVLESYTKYVHNLARNMDIESDMYPVPPQKTRVRKFKPRSEVVDAVYDLSAYERIVQVMDLPSTRAQTLFEVIRTNLPEGVELSIREFSDEDDELRYLPDHEMEDLREQLGEIERAREERKKK